MALIIAAFMEVLRRPTLWDIAVELVPFVIPLWIAVLVGIFVGWFWKPRLDGLGMDESSQSFTSLQFSHGINQELSGLVSVPKFNSLKSQLSNCFAWISDANAENSTVISPHDCSSSEIEREKSVVTVADFDHLFKLVDERDGGLEWKQMMDRSTPTMSYQAWRRDPETGPPQYRSRTVYEDVTAELMRDFFWDDEFRSKWDDMLIYSASLEECPTTGTMIVHWIRKFPFFCSDREYTIGRRIWKSGNSYYCVTKGIPCPAIPRKNKPRRVDLYYSSWCIRPVESRKGDGQMTACEILLFHHEDMGIPWEIAKLGVRQGMWGAVKKIEPGLRAYQTVRATETPLSRSALMAQINVKVDEDYLKSSDFAPISSDSDVLNPPEKPGRMNIPKFLFVSGALVLACSLDGGLLTKAVIFGVTRRLAKLGGKF